MRRVPPFKQAVCGANIENGKPECFCSEEVLDVLNDGESRRISASHTDIHGQACAAAAQTTTVLQQRTCFSSWTLCLETLWKWSSIQPTCVL